MGKEPEPLRRGKAFHKLIQDEWARDAQGEVCAEFRVRKPSGRRGRVDVFVNDDDPDGVVAIVEIKATDWDRIKPQNIRRNVKRQIRQIWSYIESQVLNNEYVEGGEGKDVSPGIIFPRRPRDPKLMQMIEDLFIEEGIPVVWHDESFEEAKKRNLASQSA